MQGISTNFSGGFLASVAFTLLLLSLQNVLAQTVVQTMVQSPSSYTTRSTTDNVGLLCHIRGSTPFGKTLARSL
jgi:hypothetical protein